MLPPLEHEIKLKECVLTRVNCTKYLCVCIDEHLLWSKLSYLLAI